MIYFTGKKNASSGFTLIELLVVIAIIGVLASVVLASLNNARRKSRDARRVTDVKQIQLALELYFDGVGAGNYPLANATACDGTQTNVYGLDVLVSNGYIASVPHDPNAAAASSCYRYASIAPASARTSYHLAAVLEDATNSVLNSDKDCDDNVTSGATACATVASVGTKSQGVNSVDCAAAAGAAGTDRCYDVIP